LPQQTIRSSQPVYLTARREYRFWRKQNRYMSRNFLNPVVLSTHPCFELTSDAVHADIETVLQNSQLHHISLERFSEKRSREE
jgi:hypothetical protein